MYIAVDIGGTNIRVAGSASVETIKFVGEPLRTRNTPSYEAGIKFVVDSAKKIGGADIQALGICLPGTPNDGKTGIRSSQNNGHWSEKSFVTELGELLDCPVFMDNDAVAAALGESYYAGTKGDFAYVIWGTGVGGVLVDHADDGTVVIRDINKQWDHYFKQWERDCGGRWLSKAYQKPTESLSADEWQDVFAMFTAHTEEFIQEVRPKTIIFAGGLSQHHAAEIAALSKKLGVTLQATRLGSESGLYGALALIKGNLHD